MSAAGNWNNSYYLGAQFFLEVGFREETKLQADERSCLFSYAIHQKSLRFRSLNVANAREALVSV